MDDALDSLDAIPASSSVSASDLDPTPGPFENYTQAAQRVSNATGAALSQTRQLGRVKAADFTSRGIPYTTDATGDTSALTDWTGAALTSADPRNKVAYDSTGNPVDYSQRNPQTGKPVVQDAFSNTPVTTDQKTGDQYKIHAGLPWQYQGQDPDIAAANAQAQQATINQQTSAALAAPEADAQKVVRNMAGQAKLSAKNTGKTLTGLGVPLTDETGNALDLSDIDAPTLQQHIESSFNQLYAAPEANATPLFGGGEYSKDAQLIRTDLDNRKQQAMQAAVAHVGVLNQYQQAQDNLDQISSTRRSLAADRLATVNQKRAAAGMAPVTIPGMEEHATASDLNAPAQPAPGIPGLGASSPAAAPPAQPQPQDQSAAGTTQGATSANPTPDTNQSQPITGLENVATRASLVAGKSFEDGIRGVMELAKTNPSISPAAWLLDKFGQSDKISDALKARADKMDAALAGQSEIGTSGKQESLAPTNAAGNLTANIVGGLIGNAPGIAAGGIPGLVALGTQSMGEAAASAHDQAKQQGASDDEAANAASTAALKTLPTTALYALTGKATSSVLSKIIPLEASPLSRAAAALVAGTGANIAAAAVGKGVVGENPTPTVDDAVNAVIFAAHGASTEHQTAQDLATAKSIVNGTHPEMGIMDGIAEGKVGQATPEQQQSAAQYANALRAVARDYIEKAGYKSPLDSQAETPPASTESKPAEKPVQGRVVEPTPVAQPPPIPKAEPAESQPPPLPVQSEKPIQEKSAESSQQPEIDRLQKQVTDSTLLRDQASREGNGMAVAIHDKERADAQNELNQLQTSATPSTPPAEPETTQAKTPSATPPRTTEAPQIETASKEASPSAAVSGSSNEGDTSSQKAHELMSPEEFDAMKAKREEITPERRAKELAQGGDPNKLGRATQNERGALLDALANGKPVNAALLERYNANSERPIKIPEGYVKNGERYERSSEPSTEPTTEKANPATVDTTRAPKEEANKSGNNSDDPLLSKAADIVRSESSSGIEPSATMLQGRLGGITIERAYEILERLKKDGVVTPASDTVDDAAHEAATSPLSGEPMPTPAQVEAGNHLVGRAKIGPLQISVQHSQGAELPEGAPATVHKGWIRGTQTGTGENMPVMVKPGISTDYQGPVHVVNNPAPDGKTEHTAVIGAQSPHEAVALHNENSPTQAKVGDVATFKTVQAFHDWASKSGHAAPAKGDLPLHVPGLEDLDEPKSSYSEAANDEHPEISNARRDEVAKALQEPEAKEVVDRLKKLKGVKIISNTNGRAFETDEHGTTVNLIALAHILDGLETPEAKSDYVVNGLDEELKHQASMIALKPHEAEAIGESLTPEERTALEAGYGAKMPDNYTAGHEAVRAFMQAAEGKQTEAARLFTEKARTDGKFRAAIEKVLNFIKQLAKSTGALSDRLAEGIRRTQAVLDGLNEPAQPEESPATATEGILKKAGAEGIGEPEGSELKTDRASEEADIKSAKGADISGLEEQLEKANNSGQWDEAKRIGAELQNARSKSLTEGAKVRVGNSPQLHTITEELAPQKGDLPDEKYFRTSNDKTGHTQVVESRDITPVKERSAAEKAAAKETAAKTEAELDKRLKAAGMDPSALPDIKNKKAALRRYEARQNPLGAANPMAEDNEQQARWMTQQAQARGFDSVNQLADSDPKGFGNMAKQWRAFHHRQGGNYLNDGAAKGINEQLHGPSKSATTSQDSLADAAAHTGAVREAVGSSDARSKSGTSDQDSGPAERDALVKYAKGRGEVLDKLPAQFTGKNIGGGEHDVYFDPKTQRVVKITSGDGESMGYYPTMTKDGGIALTRGTPAQYLDNLKLRNEVFGDDNRLHGVLDKGDTSHAIISQPHVTGEKPTPEQITSNMQEAGFRQMDPTTFYRKRDNVAVFDMKPENAFMVGDSLVPIDGIVTHPNKEMVDALKEYQLSHVAGEANAISHETEEPKKALGAAAPNDGTPSKESTPAGEEKAPLESQPESLSREGASDDDTGKPEEGKTGAERLIRQADEAGLSYSLETLKKLMRGEDREPQAFARIRAQLKAVGKDPLGAGNPIRSLYDKAAATIQSAKDEIKSAGTRDVVVHKFDSTNTISNYEGGKAASSIKLDLPNAKDREAMPFVIEAGGDKAKLMQAKAKVAASKDPNLAKKYAPVLDRAVADFDRLNDARKNHDVLMEANHAKLTAGGVDVGHVEDYVTRKLEEPENARQMLPSPLFGMGGGQGSSPKYFTKGRAFETLADAIQAGYRPKSTDLADLDQHRIEAGEKILEQKKYIDNLKATPAPTDGKPIIGKLETRNTLSGKDEKVVPKGYDMVNVMGAPTVVHRQFADTFKNLFGHSAVRSNPVGRALLKFAAAGKHGTLVFDTFHVGRLLFKMANSGGGMPVTMRDGKPAWNIQKGLSLLEYSDADLNRAVQQKLVTPKEAAYARKNRPMAEELMKAGLNVGKVADNLMDQAKLKLPIVSKLNDWIFQKVARGSMIQTALNAFERNLKQPGMTREQAARQTAKEMNEYFGNLQNQGLFTNKTLQDVSRLVFLAPQWTESQAKYEWRAYAQAAKSGYRFAKSGGKDRFVGNSTRAMVAGFAALLAVNQILNYFSRKKTTMENPEEGHKLDAWLPGGKRGFWLDPAEISAEYFHAAEKYFAQHENPVDIGSHIVSNKLSPLARGVKEGLTGRDYAGRHFLNNSDRFRAAIVDALPSPLPLGAVLEKDPRQPLGYRFNHHPLDSGSAEKQLLQSAGAKVTAAPAPRTQMFAIAQPYRADRGRTDNAGEYTELRRALDNDNKEGARSEIQWLQSQGKPMDSIAKAVGWTKANTVRPEMFAGSQEREAEMLQHLTPAQKTVYQDAQRDHLANAIKFQQWSQGINQPRSAIASLPKSRMFAGFQ